MRFEKPSLFSPEIHNLKGEANDHARLDP
jgi:hypothetical protein